MRNHVKPLPDGVAAQILARAPFSFVLCDPSLPDCPIVYVNDVFTASTGYEPEDAVGRNCRFLQGAATDPATIARLGRAVQEKRQITSDVLNYRADGTAFWNRLMIAPLTGADGATEYFAGVQHVLGDPPDDAAGRIDEAVREIQHRVKNHLQMIIGMIQVQARTVADSTPLTDLARRVESLRILYDELSYREGENRAAVALGPYLSRVAGTVASLDGREGVRVDVQADVFTAPMDVAVQLGLILSELLTNALRHAFVGRAAGRVEVRVEERLDGGVRLRVEDDGVGLPTGTVARPGGLGGRITASLSRGLGGEIVIDGAGAGTSATLDLPAAIRVRRGEPAFRTTTED